jgi:hypothetical protein
VVPRRPETKVAHLGVLNIFPLACFMKINFSIIAPLSVIGLFATTPNASAQLTISIDYPTEGQTATTTTIPGVGGTAGPFGSGISEVLVTLEELGENNPENYVATGTTSWSVEGPIQLPVTPGVAGVVGIRAYCQGASGSGSASTFVYYAPPPPTVSISTPSSGQTFTTSPVTVSGEAESHEFPYTPINLVQVQANGTNGTWQTASLQTSGSLTTGWSALVWLSPGADTIYARTQDGNGLYSTNVWVNVAYSPPIVPPVLVSVKQSSNLVFTWPTSESGFVLQCSSNLGSAAVWSTNLPAPVVVGGQNVVTNPLAKARMFFRLCQTP